MCYAIPIFANRVAPRCTIAEYILFLIIKGNRIVSSKRIKLNNCTWIDLIHILDNQNTDVLICGGINRATRDVVESHGIMIIDNVCCGREQVQDAVVRGIVHSGYGFSADQKNEADIMKLHPSEAGDNSKSGKQVSYDIRKGILNPSSIDCLECEDKVCLRGELCRPGLRGASEDGDPITHQILESSLDVMAEKERTLCRLTELIYFCLGMKYRKIGLAFCIEMFEQTEILAGLLRRFFRVYPVCCKIGGKHNSDMHIGSTSANSRVDFSNIDCNPIAQARMLNRIETDINIIIGLCMGVDCVFSKESKAPVSTLFVKDKSLAHNPIGALYSDYYLKEITKTKVVKT